jgi:hypothetical protein
MDANALIIADDFCQKFEAELQWFRLERDIPNRHCWTTRESTLSLSKS